MGPYHGHRPLETPERLTLAGRSPSLADAANVVGRQPVTRAGSLALSCLSSLVAATQWNASDGGIAMLLPYLTAPGFEPGVRAPGLSTTEKIDGVYAG
jgi:hypothetical protein